MSPIVCRTFCIFFFLALVIGGILQADTDRGSSATQSTRPFANSSVSAVQTTSVEQRPDVTSDPLDRPLNLDQKTRDESTDTSPAPKRQVGLAMTTIVGGLAICLGIFLLIVVLMRRNSTNKFGPLPSEVIESLGRMSLNQRQQLQLIRLGRKLVLLNVTAQGTTAICEIDEPDEVTWIVGLCQQDRPNSVTATFRDVLGQIGSEPAAREHIDGNRSTNVAARAPVVSARRGGQDRYHG